MGMKKVKRLVALLFLLIAASSMFASGSDIVVLMDASGTILPWFEQVNNRILPDITEKFVRQGDTFHLISFNSRVNLEIVQPVHDEQDVSRIVSRFMLLYPLGQNSDFLSGLQYTWQYVSSLPQRNEKTVVIISDGIFNPPAKSRYAGYSTTEVQSEINSLARKIRGAGWNVYYIKLPFPDKAVIRNLDDSILCDTSTGEGEHIEYYEVSSEFTSSLNIKQSVVTGEDVPVDFVDTVFSLPEVIFPQDLGKTGHFFTLPLKISNNYDSTVNMELTGVLFDSVNILDKTAFLTLKPGKSGTLKARIQLPETMPLGTHTVPLTLQFANKLRTSPQSSYVTLTLQSFSLTQMFHQGGPVAYGLFLVVITLIIVLLVFFFIVHRTSRPGAAAIRAAAHSDDSDADVPTYASGENRDKTIAYASGENRDKTIAYASGENRDKTIAYASGENRDKTIAYVSGENRDKTIDYADNKPDANATLAAQVSELEKAKRERYSILSGAVQRNEANIQRKKGANSNDTIQIRENKNIMLELFVKNQNTAIGRRNVHMMRAGNRLSIGGNNSGFLVFLVQFPSKIAEVRFDGTECTLAILKPEFFPYEDSVIIENCIHREFTIVSDHGYEVSFSLREFDDPVVRLNRLLTSIQY